MNPEIRMLAHLARRDAAHPQRPQIVRGVVVEVAPVTVAASAWSAVCGPLLPCLAIPLGEVAARVER